jgi:histidinol-phosphate aminotransferase
LRLGKLQPEPVLARPYGHGNLVPGTWASVGLAGLVAQGWDVPIPQGNFVWFPTGPLTAEAADTFERHGIVARALGEGLRVSIGEHEAVEKLLRAAQEVVDLRRTAPAAATLD